MVDLIKTIGDFASTFLTIVAVLTLLFKPVREKIKDIIVDTSRTKEHEETLMKLSDKVDTILGDIKEIKVESKIQREANQSLLRSKITETYYANLKNETLREYEAQALHKNYKAYKGERGNSFVDTIYKIMCSWKVLP